MRFRVTATAIDTDAARRELLDPVAGGYVSFEGWVRDHSEGREVTGLEYEAFPALALKEGERILSEAIRRFPVEHVLCIHRLGALAVTDMAVWVGVSAAHRGEAFDACRFIIDAVKHRVPIWKKEHYRGGDSGWVNCERCAAAASLDDVPEAHSQARAQAHHAEAHSQTRAQAHHAEAHPPNHAAPAPSPARDHDHDHAHDAA